MIKLTTLKEQQEEIMKMRAMENRKRKIIEVIQWVLALVISFGLVGSLTWIGIHNQILLAKIMTVIFIIAVGISLTFLIKSIFNYME